MYIRRLLVVGLLLCAACDRAPSARGQPLTELFTKGDVDGDVRLGGPFATLDMHAAPEDAQRALPDYWEQKVRLPGFEPPLYGYVKPNVRWLWVQVDLGGRLAEAERALREVWGPPACCSASSNVTWWVNPTRGIQVELSRSAAVLRQVGYVPAARLFGDGGELTFGGTHPVLGAHLDALETQHDAALQRGVLAGKPIAALELFPTEFTTRPLHVQLEVDPETSFVTGYTFRLVDDDSGARLRALFVERWGPPEREQAPAADQWTLDWPGRRIQFNRGPLDIYAGTAVR